MRQAIRALSWATKILWIILLALVITIAYSASQINISLGEQQITATQRTITISFPVSIRNQGLYDIAQLNVTTRIASQNSQTLATGTTVFQLVKRGTTETRTHSIRISIRRIIDKDSNLLFDDTVLTVFQYVSLNYANAVPFTAYANQTMQWGAPLSNLAIQQITYQPYNMTHSTANVRLYFENHNQYVAVTGNLRIEIYNSHQALMGSGTTTIDAQPNTSCNAQINVLVENSRITSAGELHLFFETSTFNYGPKTIPYNLSSMVTP
jgi:hypothetical protein